MATGTLQQAEGILKITTGRYTSNFETVPLLFNRLNKGSGNALSDRGFEIPTGISGNWNHGFMTDGGAYPAGGSTKTLRPAVYFKEFVGSTRLTVRAVETIKGDAGSVKSWLALNMDGQIETGYKMSNRYAYGTGNGLLGTISTGAASTTQTFNNDQNVRYFGNGMKLDFWDPTFSVLRGTATVTSYPIPGQTTITIDSSVTTVTGDYVTVHGGANQAFTGIKAIVDDTTEAPVMFQSVSRNTYPNYRAQVIDADGAGLDLELLTQMIGAKIQVQYGMANRDKTELWAYPSQTAAFQSLGWNLKRIEEGSKSVKLGYTSYEFQGMAFTEDVDCDKDRVYYLDFDKLEKFVAKGFGWMQTDGRILRLIPSSTSGSAYDSIVEGYWNACYNFGSPDPRPLGKIIGLSVQSGY
jgi:hypothetical protein